MTDRMRDGGSHRFGNYLYAGLATLVASLVGLPFRDHVDPDNVALFYLTATVFSTLRLGLGPGLFSTLLGTLAYNLLFVEPYYTLEVFRPSGYFTLSFLFLTSLAAAGIARPVVSSIALARREQAETRRLLALSRDLTATRTLAEIHQSMVRHLSGPLGCDISLHLPKEGGWERFWQGGERHRDAIIAATMAIEGAVSDGILLQRLEVDGDNHGFLAADRVAAPAFAALDPLWLDMAATLVAGAFIRVKQADEAAKSRAESENEKLRNVLISSLSHDLRTPLTVLGGTVSNLMRMRRKLPREALDEVTSLSLQVSQLQTFTANLLKVATIASGGLKLNRDAYMLQEILGAAIGRLAETRGDRHIGTVVVGTIPLVDIDGALVEQVVVNLIENAIAHTANEGRIVVSLKRVGEMVEVGVSDDGPGVPEGEIETVFERFRIGSGTGDRHSRKGTGLGLAICRGIVEAHGGTIRARNGGELPGATFLFTLPVWKGEASWDN